MPRWLDYDPNTGMGLYELPNGSTIQVPIEVARAVSSGYVAPVTPAFDSPLEALNFERHRQQQAQAVGARREADLYAKAEEGVPPDTRVPDLVNRTFTTMQNVLAPGADQREEARQRAISEGERQAAEAGQARYLETIQAEDLDNPAPSVPASRPAREQRDFIARRGPEDRAPQAPPAAPGAPVTQAGLRWERQMGGGAPGPVGAPPEVLEERRLAMERVGAALSRAAQSARLFPR